MTAPAHSPAVARLTQAGRRIEAARNLVRTEDPDPNPDPSIAHLRRHALKALTEAGRRVAALAEAQAAHETPRPEPGPAIWPPETRKQFRRLALDARTRRRRPRPANPDTETGP